MGAGGIRLFVQYSWMVLVLAVSKRLALAVFRRAEALPQFNKVGWKPTRPSARSGFHVLSKRL